MAFEESDTEVSDPSGPRNDQVASSGTVSVPDFSDIVFGLSTKVVSVNMPAGSNFGWKLAMPGTESYGVRIQYLVAGGVAQIAGLRSGDLLVGVNSTAVLSSTGDWADIWDINSIERAIQASDLNRPVMLTVVDEDDYDFKVAQQLEGHWQNEPEAQTNLEDNVMPSWMANDDEADDDADDGAAAAPVDETPIALPDFAEIVFGLRTRVVAIAIPPGGVPGWKLVMPSTESYGVRVQSVVAGSVAGAGGARSGDLLVGINETAVLTSTGDWADIWDLNSIERAIQNLSDGQPILVTVVDEDDYDFKVTQRLESHWQNEPEAQPRPEDAVTPAWMDDDDDDVADSNDDDVINDIDEIRIPSSPAPPPTPPPTEPTPIAARPATTGNPAAEAKLKRDRLRAAKVQSESDAGKLPKPVHEEAFQKPEVHPLDPSLVAFAAENAAPNFPEEAFEKTEVHKLDPSRIVFSAENAAPMSLDAGKPKEVPTPPTLTSGPRQPTKEDLLTLASEKAAAKESERMQLQLDKLKSKKERLVSAKEIAANQERERLAHQMDAMRTNARANQLGLALPDVTLEVLGLKYRWVQIERSQGGIGFLLGDPPMDRYGVRVKQLKPGGAAEIAGCQPGDVIAAVQETVVLSSAGDWADLWSLRSVKAAIDAIPHDRPLFVCLVDGDKYDNEVASLWEDESEFKLPELGTPALVQDDNGGENNGGDAIADDLEAPAPDLTTQTEVTALKPSAPTAAVDPIAAAAATAVTPVAEVRVAEAPGAEAPATEDNLGQLQIYDAAAPVAAVAVMEARLTFSDLVFGLPTRTVLVDVPVDTSLGCTLTMPGVESYGVRIQSIVAGSPMGAAGARSGDLLVAVNETAVLTSTGDWADIWDVNSIERTIQHTREINPNAALTFTVVNEDDYDDKIQEKLVTHWTNEPEAQPNPNNNVSPTWMDDDDDIEEEAIDDQGLSDNENIEPANVTARSDAWGDSSEAKRRVSFAEADLERKARAVENDLDRLTDSLRVRNDTSFGGVPRSPAVGKSPARRSVNIVTPMSARSTASFGGSPVTPLTPLSPNLPRPAGDRLSSSLLGMPSYMPSYQGTEESIMATSPIGSKSKPMTSSYLRPVDDYLDVSTTRDIMEQVEQEQRSEQRSKMRADPNISLRPGGRYNGGAGMSSAERMEFEAEIDDLQLRLEQLSKQYTKTEGARTLLEDRIRILDNAKDDDAYRLRQASLETSNMKSRMNALTSETDHANAETAKMKAKWAVETDKVIQLLSQCQRYADAESEMQSQISVMRDQIEVQERMDAQNANVIASLKLQNNDLLKEGTESGLRVSELESATRELETANSLMEAQLRSTSGDHANFRESATAQLANVQFENRSLTDKIKDLTKRLADSEDEKFQLEMKLSTSVSKFESATSGQQHESAKVQQLTSDSADLRTRLIAAATLQTELNHAADSISGLEADLATSRQDVSRLTIELADASEANNKAMYDAARSSEAFSDFEGRVADGIRQAEEAARALIQKDQDLLNERQRFDASLRDMEASHSQALARASLEMSSLRELYDGLELEVAKERGEKERQRQNMSRQQAALNEGADLETELRAALERSDSRLNQIETEKTQGLTDLGKARSDLNALLAQLAASKETAGMLEVAVKTLRSDNSSLKLQASDHQQDIAMLSKHKQELESILMQSDTLGKDLKGRLENQMARGSALEGGIEGLSAQKTLNIKMMSEMQGKILELENKLAEAEAARDAAEARADENVRLWESEVKSRSKIGLKVMDMEKHAAAWEDRLIRERQRTAAAVGRKRELEGKLDNVYQRSSEFEGQAAAASERLRAAQRELELYKAGTIRSGPAEAEIQSIRAQAEAEKARLTAELSSVHQEAELAAAARANEAVARATAIGNLVPKSQLEEYKRSLESQANKRINASIQAVNSELAHVQLEHEHKVHNLAGQVTHAKTDLASQTLSRIRAESELTGIRRGDSAEALARSRLALRVTEARSKLNQSKARLHAQAPRADLSSSTVSSRAAVARARARAQQLLSAARMPSNR